MSDKEKLINLLTEFGVEFVLDKNKIKNNNEVVRCEQGDKKVGGYSCFFTDFEFDENGNFIEMGAWE